MKTCHGTRNQICQRNISDQRLAWKAKPAEPEKDGEMQSGGGAKLGLHIVLLDEHIVQNYNQVISKPQRDF